MYFFVTEQQPDPAGLGGTETPVNRRGHFRKLRCQEGQHLGPYIELLALGTIEMQSEM